MRMIGKLSPERYLVNKEYFDAGLIECLEYLNSQNEKLRREAGIRKATIAKLRHKVVSMTTKIKDLNVKNYNLAKSDKSLNEELDDIRKLIEDLRKEFEDEVEQSNNLINGLQDEIKQKDKIIDELRYRDNKNKKRNASNSNIPTSYEVIKANANSRVSTGNKRGGQKGHRVHRSSLKANPDEIICKTVKEAPCGAVAVTDDSNNILYYAVQEINAKLKPTVTEIRYYIEDTDNEISKEEQRKYKINCSTYSDEFKALILYMSCKGTIALDRLCKMIKEMSDGEINLSPSTIVKWTQSFYVYSEKYREEIINKLLESWVIHLDETGYRVNGNNKWMHVMCNDKYAFYILLDTRKSDEEGPVKMLENFEGVAVHDHLKSYYHLNCFHSECNAHILRYLKASVDYEKDYYSQMMINLLMSSIHRKNELVKAGIKEFPEEELKEIERKYDEIIDKALTTFNTNHPNAKAIDVPDSIKTFRRMKEYKPEHLRFLTDIEVPATNNMAEKTVRVIAAKKKISGQSITIDSGNAYASLLTVVETANRQGKNCLEEIKNILSDQEYTCL